MAISDSQTSAPNKGFDLLRRRVRGHQGMIIGSVIVVSVLLIALLAPLLAPHDPYQQDLLKRLIPPVWDSRGSWEHVLGPTILAGITCRGSSMGREFHC